MGIVLDFQESDALNGGYQVKSATFLNRQLDASLILRCEYEHEPR